MTIFAPFLAGQGIDLDDCILERSGRTRNVHEHKALPGLLIKTMRPDLVDRNGYFKAYQWWKKGRPHGVYFAFRREIDEFIVLCRRQYAYGFSSLPIAGIHGLVRTSAGLGLVVERIAAKDGGLAPTMTELISESRFEVSHMHALERFLDRCRELHIVFGDLTVNNIVYTEARDPRGEFVAVDGFGEKSAIPIHRWSTQMNNRKIERVRKRLLSAVPARLKKPATV